MSCCDSRAGPESVFNMGPGQLFTVRNVANLVPPYDEDDHFHGTTAAIEFAVSGLRVSNIVVMGHASCGGVAAFLDNSKLPPNTPVLARWAQLLEPAMQRLRNIHEISGPERCTANHEYDLKVILSESSRKGLLNDMTRIISEAGSILNASIAKDVNRFAVSVPDGWLAIESTMERLCRLDGVKSAQFFEPNPQDPKLRQRELELMSIEESLLNLESFPAIKELRSINEIKLFGAWFDIHSGQLFVHSRQGKDRSWEEI